MTNCEIFSLRRNRSDFMEFEGGFDYTSALLRENDIDVKYKTDINADANKLADALEESTKSDDIELFIFVNALNTSDSSSFRKLFYEYILRTEATLKPDPTHQGMTPKLKIFSMGDMGMGYKGYCFKLYNRLFVALPCASLAQESSAELILKGVRQAREITERNYALYPAGIVYPEAENNTAAAAAIAAGAVAAGSRMLTDKKAKKGFWRSFIPQKGDSKGVIARKIVVLIAIAAFIGAMIYVINYFIIGPAQNNAINDEIRELAYNNEDPGKKTPDGKKKSEQDWDALKKINKEIVGWIRMDDSRIDYPVMFHKGDDANEQYYLNHTYKHEWSEYGTVFIDYRSTHSTKSKNVILHGHNMTDGSMFHELINFSEGFVGDIDYYRDHPVLTFNTPDGDAKWKIISVFKTSTLYAHGEFFNYMQGDFTSQAEFMNFVYNLRIRSMFNVPVTVNESDQILTLSTCSYEYTNFRTVVVARKVRKGEDAKVDVKLASVNEDPFLPEVCYDGDRPDPGTFKSAYKGGKINWYDGKYNGKDDNTLKGSEVLTGTVAANPTEPPTEKPTKRKPGETDPPTSAPTSRKVFTVTYTNMDGSQFASYSVMEGDPVPVPEGHPTYDDEYYTYTFTGWDRDIPGADFEHLNKSLSISPKFDHERKSE